METPIHPLSSLFKQLGLPDDAQGIDQFITSHSPLELMGCTWPMRFSGARASGKCCATRSSRMRDWAEVIDQLDVLLRKGRGE